MSRRKTLVCEHVYDYGRVQTRCPGYVLPGTGRCRVHQDTAKREIPRG